MKMLVGLCGKAGSGKDTAANHLVQEYDFHRVAFADMVRNCALAIDPYVKVEVRPARWGWVRRLPVDTFRLSRLSELVDAVGWDEAKRNPDVRRCLQRVGTEMGRQVLTPLLPTDTLWVDLAWATADPYERVVITDVRFNDEATAIKAEGGLLVGIERPNAGLDGEVGTHASEGGIESTLVDHWVLNSGTPEDLGEDLAFEVEEWYQVSLR